MTDPTPPTVPGLTLGPVLGRGSTGVVYAARHDRDGREYAVKVASVDATCGGFEQLRREVDLAGSLRLPHLVRAHEVIRCPDGRVALVLDLVGGGSIAGILRQRRHLLAGEVVGCLHPVLVTLHHLHERGIVHGDVSAGNVLLSNDGRPMLTDLGDARVAGEGRARIRGTDGYVAPELTCGGSPTASSDVYAVGALAWFLLVGAPAAIGFLRPPLAEAAPDTPPALVAVVESMLSGEAGERPTAADAAAALVAAHPPRPVDLPEGPDLAEQLTRRLRDGGRPALSPAQRPKRPAHPNAVPEGRHRRVAPGRTPARSRSNAGVAGSGRARRTTWAVVVLSLAAAALGSWWANGRWHLLPGSRPSAAAAQSGADGASIVSVPPATADPERTPTPSAPSTPSALSSELSPSSASTPGDALAAVRTLIDARAAAYRSGDPASLAQVYAPGSRALLREEAAVGVLASASVRYDGLRYVVRAAVAGPASPTGPPGTTSEGSPPGTSPALRVTATIDTSAYTIVGPGRSRTEVPAKAGAPVVLAIARTDQGWRLTD